MVRSIHKTKIAVFAFAVAGTLAITTNIKTQNINAAHDDSKDVTFNVNIAEALTVAITEPTSWADGESGAFLRNKIDVTAYSNTQYGATVSMYTNDTKLKHTSSFSASDITSYIPSVTSNNIAVANFPNNSWGYSVNNGSSYNSIPTTSSPTTIITTTQAGRSGTQSVYFGAKADNAKKSGSYEQNVYFAAVSRVNTTDPTTPVIPPANPATDAPTNNTATYNGTTTSYTYRTPSTDNTTTTTTTIASPGDTTGYQYVTPQGVTASTMGEGDGSTLATTLAVIATVAATSGLFFFVLAKRRKDDEEDEDQV